MESGADKQGKETIKEEVARALETGFKDAKVAIEFDLKYVIEMLKSDCVKNDQIVKYIKENMLR